MMSGTIRAFKVVAVADDGRRISATHYRLPKDYVQTYVGSDGRTSLVQTAMVFETMEHAIDWIDAKKGLEVWGCTCGTTEPVAVVYPFSGMNEINASERAPYDPQEMHALVSGSAVRIWPDVRAICEDTIRRREWIVKQFGYKEYDLRMATPPGALIATDVLLTERV